MHCQVIILEKNGSIHKQISDAFNQLIKGYDLLQCYSIDDVFYTAKKRLIDIILINADDFLDEIVSGKQVRAFKDRIRPVPKIILFLELKLMKMYSSLEKEVDLVIDSGANLTFVEIQDILNGLLGKSLISGRDISTQISSNLEDKMSDYERAKEDLHELSKSLKRKEES